MDKTIDDLFILKLIKAGDRLAFKHLFELYFTPLCRFVHLYEETGSRRGYRSRYLCQLLGKTGDLTNPDHVESLSIPVRTE